MTSRPALTGKAVIGVLQRHGFMIRRKKGSHFIMAHPDGRITVIPVHAGETIGPGLFAKILRDTELTKDSFR